MATARPDDLEIWVQEVGAFLRSPLSALVSRWVQLGLTSSRWAIRALAVISILVLCVFMSSLAFTWFYFTMMPIKHSEKPIYFDFSKTSPEALVSLVGNQWEYKTPSPYNLHPITTFLTSGIPYDVDVEFTVASQVAASQSGMLMIEAKAEHAFRDKVQSVAYSKRPVEIEKVLPAIQTLRAAMMLMPMLLGLYSPSVRVKTRIFERFVDYQQFSISRMNLTLIRAPTHLGEIHLSNAVLRFSLHLFGWRFLFYTYFWTSAFVLIPSFGLLLFVFALGSYFTMSTKTVTVPMQQAADFQADVEEEETASGYDRVPTSRSHSPSPKLPDSKPLSPASSEVSFGSRESSSTDDGAEPIVEDCEFSVGGAESIFRHSDVSNNGTDSVVQGNSVALGSPPKIGSANIVVESEAKSFRASIEEDAKFVKGTDTEHVISDFEQIDSDNEDDITLVSSVNDAAVKLSPK